MVLAAFLGGIKGAADRNSLRLQQNAENNKSLTERMIDGTNSYNTAINDKDTLYYMNPFMQLASNRTQFSINVEDPQQNSLYVQAIQNSEYNNGRPNFFVPNTAEPLRNIGRLVDLDVGYQFSHLVNDENELGDDVRRWESATTATLSRMLSDSELKNLESGVAIGRTPIHNQIPGWDNFTPQRKQYYNGLIARAAGLRLSQAEAMQLVKPTGLTTRVQEDEDNNIRIVAQKFPNKDGTFTAISNIPKEIVTSLTGVSKNQEDPASQFVSNTLESIHSMNQAKGVSYQESVSTVQYLNDQFVRNRIQESGGVLYSTPSDEELIKQQTRKIYNQVGMGDFIELTAAAIPEQSLYKLVDIPAGSYENFKNVRRNAYEALVIGIDNSDKRKKFKTKTQDLRTLKSNITEFLTVMERGAFIGTAADLQLFKDGVTSFVRSLQTMFGDNIDYINKVGDGLLGQVSNALDGLNLKEGISTGQLTQIGSFLEKQLAYSVARALESSTGNARLSNIDVDLARQSLGLSGIFASKQNATAVLTLLLGRTERELEYQKALGSRRLRKMQAAEYAMGLYGAESLLRVTSADNQAAAYDELRRSIEAEAQRTGITLAPIEAPKAREE